MRGIILAAGRGSRMGAATDHAPKCETVLGGRPLIEWQMHAMRSAGVGRIAVITGYRREMLRKRADHEFFNARWADTQMVMSLAEAEEWLLDGPCVVSYSDIVYRVSVVERLMASEGYLAITFDALWEQLWAARFEDPLTDAESFEVDPHGELASIGRRAKSRSEIQGQYMGLLKFTPQSWQWVAELLRDMDPGVRDRLDMTSLLDRLLSSGRAVTTVRVEGGWCEVDNEKDLEVYKGYLARGVPWSHDWRTD